MKLLNYTGKRIGLQDKFGNPVEVLPVDGNAYCPIEIMESKSIGRVPIFKKSIGKVRGLPSPDLNLQKLYIVTMDVAEAFGNTRHDLIVGEEPYKYEGAQFYKRLVNV